MPSSLLTPEDLAEYLGVKVQTVYNWRLEKKGPRGVKVGRRLRFRLSDVETWLDENADEETK